MTLNSPRSPEISRSILESAPRTLSSAASETTEVDRGGSILRIGRVVSPRRLSSFASFASSFSSFASFSPSYACADESYTRRPQPDAGDVDLCVKRLVDAGPAPGEREWFPNLTGDMDESDMDESDMESDPECGGNF